MGGEIDLHIDKGYPAVVNNDELNKSVKNAASEFLGSENVEETELRMGAEDFGYYAQQIPACFYRVGVMNKEKELLLVFTLLLSILMKMRSKWVWA